MSTTATTIINRTDANASFRLLNVLRNKNFAEEFTLKGFGQILQITQASDSSYQERLEAALNVEEIFSKITSEIEFVANDEQDVNRIRNNLISLSTKMSLGTPQQNEVIQEYFNAAIKILNDKS